jgi:alpha-tubulin suppressor-like RCC1 family protein
MGDGTLIGKLVPTKIGTASWLTVSAGATHSLGLQKDGTLWTWGGNPTASWAMRPRAARPSRRPRSAPPPTSVSAGASHSMAIAANGTPVGLGQQLGQLGNNGVANLTSPTQISTGHQLVGGGGRRPPHHGVRTDGTLWGWGSNAEGQLGDGNGDAISPVQIGTGANWVTVSAGTATASA